MHLLTRIKITRPAAVVLGAVVLVAGAGTGAAASGVLIDSSQDVAAGSLNGTDVADNTLTSSDVRGLRSGDIADGTITGSDVADGSLSTNDYAPGSVTEVSIANESIESRDVLNGSLTGADIKNNTIQKDDLASGVMDELYATWKAGDMADTNGKRSLLWVDADRNLNSYQDSSMQVPAGDHVITMDVQSHYDQPVQVTLRDITDSDSHVVAMCTAIPAGDFPVSTCSATRQFGLPIGGTLAVSARLPGNYGVAYTDQLDIEINGVRVG